MIKKFPNQRSRKSIKNRNIRKRNSWSSIQIIKNRMKIREIRKRY